MGKQSSSFARDTAWEYRRRYSGGDRRVPALIYRRPLLIASRRFTESATPGRACVVPNSPGPLFAVQTGDYTLRCAQCLARLPTRRTRRARFPAPLSFVQVFGARLPRSRQQQTTAVPRPCAAVDCGRDTMRPVEGGPQIHAASARLGPTSPVGCKPRGSAVRSQSSRRLRGRWRAASGP
jgi:hypothetical protein